MQKCKINNNWPSSEGQKKPKASLNCYNEASFRKTSFYEIGPPSWIKIVIDARIHGYDLHLATAFCDAIGLRERSMIMLKTSMDSPGSWKVQGRPGTNCSYMLVQGWRRFFQHNSLKEGDMCTFNVVETTLWHAVITRCKERMYQFNYQETPSASSMKRKSDNNISRSVEQKDPNSLIVFKGSCKRRCVFEIGPPAWIKKEINIHTIENVISLPLSFCKAIGLRETCVVTLRTSVSSNTIWQARVIPYKHCNHLGGSGWKMFFWENKIKEGDVCTFNVVETKLWHVVITRHEEKVYQFCSLS
ncbi:unnamed protein product [Urochloa decumbens]|uniref:TF-B3 domain-containing protein n=1 Tax=Urochloa decumbens TaxID=240449 RepID=A0ABC9CBD4_9POAL